MHLDGILKYLMYQVVFTLGHILCNFKDYGVNTNVTFTENVCRANVYKLLEANNFKTLWSTMCKTFTANCFNK